MTRIEDDVVGQLEQAAQACVKKPCLAVRIAGDVQVGSPDIADQQRVATEDDPRLLVAAPEVGHDVGVVRRRMSRRRHRGHDGVAELDPIAVAECLVLERDVGALREVGRRLRPGDELGKAGDMVGLDMGLEVSKTPTIGEPIWAAAAR
jgi:hypothetical protein